MLDDNLKQYYEARAPEYEQVYLRDDPARRLEEDHIISVMKKLFTGRSLLEIACGTGYWTRTLSGTAQRIVAVDASEKMLEIARKKLPESATVQFIKGDAYHLEDIPGRFNAGLANFWFSHVPRADIDAFLSGFNERLNSGAVVFMADNMFRPDLGGELISVPGDSDTYKLRELADGSKYKVLKNYYEADQLLEIFRDRIRHLRIYMDRWYWWLTYEVA